MTENITVLTALGKLLMAKLWNADGTQRPYDLAKNFKHKELKVSNVQGLSAMLTTLATDPQTCVIRGGYIGAELATPIMRSADGWREGYVVRQDTVFKDRASHVVLIDIDKFRPTVGDPCVDTELCIAEFIATHLPDCFSDISHHWQLSNSAGSAKNAGVLKAHLWFWLETPYTGADLTAWCQHENLKQIDTACFRTVQPLYTAAPVMAPGVTDPIHVRSGFTSGLFGDSVPLVIPADALTLAAGRAVVTNVSAEIKTAVSNDPVAQRLYERGMVKSEMARGALNIICPRESEHTDGKTGATSTIYYPPFTNGFQHGNFKCLHSACTHAPRHLFTEALGFSVLNDLDGFDDVVPERTVEWDASMDDLFGDDTAPQKQPVKKGRIAVPESHHLCTDQANVQRLLKHFGKRLLVSSDRWYAWDGWRWAPDDSIATRYAMSLSKLISQEADVWAKKPVLAGDDGELNKSMAKALRAWSSKAEMRASIDAALALAKRVLVVDSQLLDQNPWLLNCTNGTVDLRTGTLQPHNPDDYITKVCKVGYFPDAKRPLFDSVLLRVFCEDGGPGPVTKFVQRWFGYCATAITTEQKFVVHYGRGANGKSTIMDTVSDVLGEYAGTAAPGLLVTGGGERHPTEIADLFGRRMVTAHETGEGGVLREDFVKQATGGDKIKARYMRADFFEFSPTHKIQMLTNHKPVIKGQDHGIWRRVVMLPYKARFGTAAEVADGTAKYLKVEDTAEKIKVEWQGVLAWIVAGAVDWHRNGLNPPDDVLAASGEYQREQDRVLHFLSENCEMGHDYSILLTDDFELGLFQIYELWCKESGFFALSKTKFVQEVERLVPRFKKQTVKVQTVSGRRRDLLKLFGVRLMQ